MQRQPTLYPHSRTSHSSYTYVASDLLKPEGLQDPLKWIVGVVLDGVSLDVSSGCLAFRRGVVQLALGGVDGEVGAAAARAPVVDDDGGASWKVSPLKVLSAHTRGRPLRGWLVSQSLQRVVSGILFIFRSRQGRASSW